MDSQIRAAKVREALNALSTSLTADGELPLSFPRLPLGVWRHAINSRSCSKVSTDTSAAAAGHCSSNQSLKYAESPLSRDAKSSLVNCRPNIRLITRCRRGMGKPVSAILRSSEPLVVMIDRRLLSATSRSWQFTLPQIPSSKWPTPCSPTYGSHRLQPAMCFGPSVTALQISLTELQWAVYCHPAPSSNTGWTASKSRTIIGEDLIQGNQTVRAQFLGLLHTVWIHLRLVNILRSLYRHVDCGLSSVVSCISSLSMTVVLLDSLPGTAVNIGVSCPLSHASIDQMNDLRQCPRPRGHSS